MLTTRLKVRSTSDDVWYSRCAQKHRGLAEQSSRGKGQHGWLDSARQRRVEPWALVRESCDLHESHWSHVNDVPLADWSLKSSSGVIAEGEKVVIA